MQDILFWVYIINAVLLINHEIDSAYWEEWKLFRMPGGISLFLLLHFPLLFLVMYGLVLVERGSFWGLVMSLVLGFGGLFAFFAHTYFIRKGHDEFTIPMSRFILFATLVVSLVQVAVTVYMLIA